MGKENGEICGGRTEKHGCSNRQRTVAIAYWKQFLRRGSTRCRWKTAPGNRGCAEVQVQRPDFSCRHARRISRFGRLCPSSADRQISGEQTYSADRANRRRKRRRPARKRARRRQARGQDRRSAGESERASRLNKKREHGSKLNTSVANVA